MVRVIEVGPTGAMVRAYYESGLAMCRPRMFAPDDQTTVMEVNDESLF